MAEVRMRVLSDIWVGDPYMPGSLHLRKGSIITIDPADAERIAQYGGSGNLELLPPLLPPDEPGGGRRPRGAGN